MKLIPYISILIMVTGLLSGCMGYRNHTVKEENRITLAEENREVLGVWTTGDLSLSYEYLLAENILKIDGRLTLASKLSHFPVMHHLRFKVHFVDSEGRVTGSKIVYTSPYREWIPMLRLSFSRSVPVPAGSVALAFSYSGSAGDGSGSEGNIEGGGVSWDFWRLP